MDNSNRMSVYSVGSNPPSVRPAVQQSTQVSTTTLLNALHTAYASGQPYRLDASTTLVLNTWLTAAHPSVEGHEGGTVDNELARQAWEHARRRAEDGCIVLGSLHHSTPALLSPFISKLPLAVPSSIYTALSVLRPFTTCVTPFNASFSRHSALAATFSLTLAGNINGANLAFAKTGFELSQGLLNIPQEAGYRAFDVFYYLLTSASTPAEREFLSLKSPSAYSLLSRSGTYQPPSYLPTADDAAASEDFRAALKAIGIKGSSHRNLISTLAALLKLGDTVGLLIDEEDLEDICEDVGGLIGIEPDVLMRKCSTDERPVLISGIYETLVDWVLLQANNAIKEEMQRIKDGDDSSESGTGRFGARTPRTDEDNEDTVSITIVEIPSQDLGKAVALRGVFDDNVGILAEMKEDGIDVTQAGHSVIKEMQNAVADVAVDLGLTTTTASREKAADRERQEELMLRIAEEAEVGGFLRKIINPSETQDIRHGMQARFDLSDLLGSCRIWYHLSIHPTDENLASLGSLASTTSAWSAGTVSKQLRTWRLPEWANYRNKALDFTADFDIDEFCTRYARLGCQDGRDGVENWIMERGWSNGEVVVGHDRVWIREGAWWEAESMLDVKPPEQYSPYGAMAGSGMALDPFATPNGDNRSAFFTNVDDQYGSRDNLMQRQQSSATLAQSAMGPAKSIAPTAARTVNTKLGDYGLGAKGDEKRYESYNDLGEYTGGIDPELADPKSIEAQPIDKSRRVWVAFVWALTFWIPSFVLRFVGRMKRPDVRMAWREKIVLMLLIFLLNAVVIFYIVAFGKLLCPNFDKAWNAKEVGYHQSSQDYYVSLRGKVYDMTKFAKQEHGDIQPYATQQTMEPLAGKNLDAYFPIPLNIGCSYLVTSDIPTLTQNQSDIPEFPNAIHTSGSRYQSNPDTMLHDDRWYPDRFLPKMQEFYKGDLVETKAKISQDADNSARNWFILNGKVYDLTSYFYTKKIKNNLADYSWIPSEVEDVMKSGFGSDISKDWKSNDDFKKTLNCLDNVFYAGKVDFRNTPKCQVNNYILLAFTIILCTVILTKFLSALQFGSKRRPSPQDKFVICQVPAYTEGEDQLRKALDSLTALQYDNKRKLICVVCDGMIVGGGNDRPTPKIVLDILGVDPKIDPPALPFKSVGQGSEQLNYGKVYSGLYEFEGNVVPYIVVVKVGKESEQTKSKPGNRGKRDSQILLMSFLNRVHHRSPMSPLELEMFHQVNNIIGVDPELYEYLLMVDADTSVKEDSLNRLVASCANDAKIAGICGETSLQNEERSWWTMIQVYEYYISHHLAKAFESLFGSVTCLPGCFCMYRIRTSDKGRPLIISDSVIKDYAICDVDTLHKKNLLSLGEDRYLTTLMMRYFPQMSYKFVPDAFASTAAPESWSVLISQRRRWINSTIHNLAELVWLKDLCGFCCFSMRFVIFIDLFGTLILPATCAYLGYLIYRVATHTGQFPLISIIMIAAVYGLQALIFIIKRQWQHVGWMIIYLLAYPIYSFILPVYSFWNQDNFTWGSTRIVIGEKGSKKVVALEDDGFDPRSVPLQRWDDYALAQNLPGRRGVPGPIQEKYSDIDNQYEMSDIHSVYSSAKPASTVLTGWHNNNTAHQSQFYMPPQSPAPFSQSPAPMYNQHPGRASTMSLGQFKDAPQYASKRHSMANMSDAPYQDHPNSPYNTLGPRSTGLPSTDNLIAMQSPPLRQQRSPLAGHSPYMGSRPASTLDFRTGILSPGQGVIDDATIQEAVRECLAEVNLDTVTKKQVRALVEQRLQTQLNAEKKAYLDREIDECLADM